MKIGILRETKSGERRTPLVPDDVRLLVQHDVDVQVESSETRIFPDAAFRDAGARLVDRADEADFLVGIKEPPIESLLPHKAYAVFSHTIKGQAENLPLLQAFMERGITLLDYESIVDRHGARLVYFGRFAGICGAVDTLHHLGAKLAWRGIDSPFASIRPAWEYPSLDAIRAHFDELAALIEKEGVPGQIAPCVIGITGHGHVSQGAQEILDRLDPVEVHPRRMAEFVEHERGRCHSLYKLVFLREEKFRSKDGHGYYFEDYLAHPDRFESNIDRYLPSLTALIHTSYWDDRYPRLVSRQMVQDVARRGALRLEVVGDLSCDIRGSFELTHRASTIEQPVYTYDYRADRYVDGHGSHGITILAVDNLPSELPLDASVEFSSQIRRYVHDIARHGLDGTDDGLGVPPEVQGALVTRNGHLTTRYEHLARLLPSLSSRRNPTTPAGDTIPPPPRATP